MKIYLDAVRPTPTGWIAARSVEETIKHLQTGQVVELSLDHDLDDVALGTGNTVLRWIEEAVALRGFAPPLMWVHTTNSEAKSKMLAAIRLVEQMSSKRKRTTHSKAAVVGEESRDVLFDGDSSTAKSKAQVTAVQVAPQEKSTGYITEKFCEAVYLDLFGHRMAGVAIMAGLDRATTEEMFRKTCISLAGSKRVRPKAIDIRMHLDCLYPRPGQQRTSHGNEVEADAPATYPQFYPFEMRHLNNLHTRRAMVGGRPDQEPPELPEWCVTQEALHFVSKLFAQSHAPYYFVPGGKDEFGKAVMMRVDLEPSELNPAQLGKSMMSMLFSYQTAYQIEMKDKDGNPIPRRPYRY